MGDHEQIAYGSATRKEGIMTAVPCVRCTAKRRRIARLEETIEQQSARIGEQSAAIVELASIIAEVRPDIPQSALVRRLMQRNPNLTNPESPLAEYRREHIRTLEAL